MQIDFLHPNYARPCDVSRGSTDKKLLSFQVRSMTLTSIEK